MINIKLGLRVIECESADLIHTIVRFGSNRTVFLNIFCTQDKAFLDLLTNVKVLRKSVTPRNQSVSLFVRILVNRSVIFSFYSREVKTWL